MTPIPHVNDPICPECLGRSLFMQQCYACDGTGRVISNRCAGNGLPCDKEARSGSHYCGECYREIMTDLEAP
jgi:hypothetical protein